MTLRRAIPLLAAGALLPATVRAAPEPIGARQGMVASVSEIASRAGVDAMQRGGNAVDAAVAVALTLAVVWPSAGNLGGGGFMLLRRADGRSEVIDYRERAPLGASRDMFLDGNGQVVAGASTVGFRAVAVPGSIAGLALAHQRHGKLPWADLVRPARELAAAGFPLSRHTVLGLRRAAATLERFPETRRIFLPGGKAPAVGERLAQPDLAATLERIERRGPREFYEGETARLLAADMKAQGGLVTVEDLRQYQATVRRPLRGAYRGHEILTVPPPSSGGVALLEVLNILARHPVGKLGQGSAAGLHLLVEAMRRAFADRAAHLGDPDFTPLPIADLVSAERAAKLDASIGARATPSDKLDLPRPKGPLAAEPPETTHFSIVDAEGNMVSNTTTLNGGFGAGVVARGTGFLLNNEMDDFTSRPGTPNAYGLLQSAANAIAPRKRPLSAMTPVIVLRRSKPWIAVGAQGGPTIISSVAQILVNAIDHGMNLREAIAAPRVHHQWMPDRIRWEPWGVSDETRAVLKKLGHRFDERPSYLWDAQAVEIDEEGLRLGASDPRLGGLPVGY